jgi:hypothetical protein
MVPFLHVAENFGPFSKKIAKVNFFNFRIFSQADFCKNANMIPIPIYPLSFRAQSVNIRLASKYCLFSVVNREV